MPPSSVALLIAAVGRRRARRRPAAAARGRRAAGRAAGPGLAVRSVGRGRRARQDRARRRHGLLHRRGRASGSRRGTWSTAAAAGPGDRRRARPLACRRACSIDPRGEVALLLTEGGAARPAAGASTSAAAPRPARLPSRASPRASRARRPRACWAARPWWSAGRGARDRAGAGLGRDRAHRRAEGHAGGPVRRAGAGRARAACWA